MPQKTTTPGSDVADQADEIGMLHVRMPMELRAKGDGENDLLARARTRASDPTILDEHPPVFFRVLASDRTIDFYSTRMMDSTLTNYAADATDGQGVPFLDSHMSDGMGKILGRSILGEFNPGKTDRTARTYVTFYTQPTLLPGMREFVDRARGGYAKDVSVGFFGGRTVCSICGNEMGRWWRIADESKRCYHIPGIDYAVVDDSGTKTGAVQKAIGLIEDARLGEVSTVMNGANENAGFAGFKARQMAEAGILLPQIRGIIEARYNIVLPGAARVWPGTEAEQTAHDRSKEGQMPESTITRATATPPGDGDQIDLTKIRTDALREATEKVAGEWRESVIGSLRLAGVEVKEGDDLTAHMASICREVVALRPLSEDGKAWRATLVTAAVVEGVRAFGDGFQKERQTARLERMSPEDIQLETESWRQIGDRAIPGGQVTRDGDGNPVADTTPKDDAPPSAAFQSRRRTAGRR